MIIFLSVFLLVQPVETQSHEIRAEVQGIISRMADCDLSNLWNFVRELESLHEEAVPAIKEGLTSESIQVRLGCAKALFSLGGGDRAEPVLRKIADSKAPVKIRLAALDLLRNSLEEGLAPVLKRIALNDSEPLVRIEASKTLWEINGDRTARVVLERFLTSEDNTLRNQAAVALGEIGYVEGPAKQLLIKLSQEPTNLGCRASLILQVERLAKEASASDNPFNLSQESLLREKEKEIKDLQNKLELVRKSSISGNSNGNPLLDWIMGCIGSAYVDPDKVNKGKLIDGAAKGIVKVLDRFSSFMDVKDTKSFNESISGSYMGIGAQISLDKKTGFLNIVRPLYNGPAYKAGLKPQDLIVEIGGIPIRDKPMSTIVDMLKGPKNTEIVLKVSRKGWKKLHDFKILRDEVKVEIVHWRMLPGSIGYIRLDSFGETAFSDVKDALEELKYLGMKGIILDLRNNPGGLLRAAVNIVDLFVIEEERPIVTQKGPIGVKEEMSTDVEPQYLTEPLVILVNGSSASASEIVSGALQDFDHRAILVGTKTYGKGSVQRVFPVPDSISVPVLGGSSSLRLTVQYYYLPSGRCIHTRRDSEGRIVKKGGVDPDIEIDTPHLSLWQSSELENLSGMQLFKDYVEKLAEAASTKEKKDFYRNLILNGDGKEADRYPGFEDFFKKLTGRIQFKKDDVRLLLRASLRRRYGDNMGRELACDFQDDIQLQRGIVEILKRISVNIKTIAAYKSFPDFKDKPKGVETADKSGDKKAKNEEEEKPAGVSK